MSVRAISKPIPIELTDAWVPNQLLVRQDDVERILELIRLWSHVYVSGPKGVGKTMVSKHCTLHFDPEHIMFVRCRRSLPLSIQSELVDRGFKISRETDLARLVADLPDPSLIVFDDIHQLYRYRQGLFFLKTIYDYAPDDHIKTIVTSTVPHHKFSKYCPEEVMSRFQWKPVSFGFYDAVQLDLILRQRAERIFNRIEEGTTAWIAAKIRRLGDPRIGMRILRYCFELSDFLNMKAVEESWQLEKKRYWKEDILLKMPPHTALLFLLISKITSAYKSKRLSSGKDGRVPIISQLLYREYNKVCKVLDVDSIYPARLNYYLNQLQKEGWIQRTRKSLGRHGYGSVIRLLFDDPDVIVEAGKEIDWETFLQ